MSSLVITLKRFPWTFPLTPRQEEKKKKNQRVNIHVCFQLGVAESQLRQTKTHTMKYFLVQMCMVRKSHQMCAFLYSSCPSPLPHLCLKACRCYVWTFLEALLACPLCKPQVYSLTHIKESSMFMLKPDTDVGFDLNCFNFFEPQSLHP